MNLSEFDFDLPQERIAQEPLPDRAGARMLVVNRAEGTWEDRMFRDFPSYLRQGDCVVLNNSRVLPSRLFGHREGVRALPIGKKNPARHEYLTKRVEVFLLHPVTSDQQQWRALVRPGKKMRLGERMEIENGPTLEIVEWGEFGERTVRFLDTPDPIAAIEAAGHMPLPPYIKRPDTDADRRRYQTVFAQTPGSVAAPTAGLHFTGEILDACRKKGANVAYVTLHVGLGTFQPLHTDVLEEVELHRESWWIPAETADSLARARRIVAVGTTSVRTLETAAQNAPWHPASGDTGLFIYPGFEFRATGAMLTNFHLPQSSLFVLVCALGGTDLMKAAYAHAVRSEYRFYSYGDCMLIV